MKATKRDKRRWKWKKFTGNESTSVLICTFKQWFKDVVEHLLEVLYHTSLLVHIVQPGDLHGRKAVHDKSSSRQQDTVHPCTWVGMT
jgi:hypothetical protein